MDGARLVCIREEKDASERERAITLCNAGLMALDGTRALSLLKAVRDANEQREFYLTDVVELAVDRGWTTEVIRVPEQEVIGVNDRAQLAIAEAAMQRRLREAVMRGGVTLVDPESVTLAFDTVIGHDTIVEPHVVIMNGVRVGSEARIRSFSHLEGVTVGDRAAVGPFARLRPGTSLGEDVHVGNFVEVKASTLASGVKANHLSYIGDAVIGARTNVGAGTITCNYDGFAKTRTTIGEGVFVGSHSSLVAPVTVGDGAYIGTGSVITEDVAPDALVIARARQVEKPGWAKAFRASRRLVGSEAKAETKS
jgi:bifunctional UDP-N-acetylglucosamine pyrophosphorylase/glucosamine-1-phosphate N-acetyltransferase